MLSLVERIDSDLGKEIVHTGKQNYIRVTKARYLLNSHQQRGFFFGWLWSFFVRFCGSGGGNALPAGAGLGFLKKTLFSNLRSIFDFAIYKGCENLTLRSLKLG